ncbi:hypothetical protein A2765_06705 [Candidatus Kaiserbacteria bacterium RIFCSPHIGHO2_01_FULL_56_24]|uniref:Uncharacterized protein n=1 Tax=Candidatus Kaiserbacteria bacterium RIFCSPHIGHO2_01_FULL_56_24 TaxID=1798487 RepID=A0A1F6DCY1_9BACT|nr:MAG: hypothetical protein A2765_06705 [Candidatus Kaiserbacteria bacterium RIFCSPHIGHO2_01_FULL_56_24]
MENETNPAPPTPEDREAKLARLEQEWEASTLAWFRECDIARDARYERARRDGVTNYEEL